MRPVRLLLVRLSISPRYWFSRTKTGQCVDTIDIHSTASTNSLTATPPEGQGRIELVLDADERIQHHWARPVQIQLVCLHAWFRARLVGVPAVDVERLHLRILARRRVLDV
jgi:hypothetical protein